MGEFDTVTVRPAARITMPCSVRSLAMKWPALRAWRSISARISSRALRRPSLCTITSCFAAPKFTRAGCTARTASVDTQPLEIIATPTTQSAAFRIRLMSLTPLVRPLAKGRLEPPLGRIPRLGGAFETHPPADGREARKF